MVKPIALTTGEPAGIGPDIILKLFAARQVEPFVVIGSKALLKARAKMLNLAIQFCDWHEDQILTQDVMSVLDVPLSEPVIPGQLNAANVAYVLTCLKTAGLGCLNQTFSAVVTGPVHKGIINEAGHHFTGQTEFFAKLCNKAENDVVMMLANKTLKIALITTHIPLKDVPGKITAARIHQVVSIIHQDFKNKFGILKPKILLCGLNPHAGEMGYLGLEEIEIINPAAASLRAQGIDVSDAISADTIFALHPEADVIVTMYHDQGLPVIKTLGFGSVVNVSLGLPIIRTSVDHGTALALAGTHQANFDSLNAAMTLTTQLVNHHG